MGSTRDEARLYGIMRSIEACVFPAGKAHRRIHECERFDLVDEHAAL